MDELKRVIRRITFDTFGEDGLAGRTYLQIVSGLFRFYWHLLNFIQVKLWNSAARSFGASRCLIRI